MHIALEYMDASLLDILRAEAAPIPEHVVAGIAAPVLDGLVYLHREKHLVHRDIKPSNLLLDSSAKVKIADFGVSGACHGCAGCHACAVDIGCCPHAPQTGEMSSTLSKCASWVGTVHYMSPERISGGTYSYDSDVWSLGITLLELATATFPYCGGGGSMGSGERAQRLGYWDLLDLIVESPPPSSPAHFSAEFKELISGCLQKLPEARASSTQLRQHRLLVQCAHPPDISAWVQHALNKLLGQRSAEARMSTSVQ